MPRVNTKSRLVESGVDLDGAAPASAISAPEQSDDIRQLLSGINSEVSALRAEILGELRSSISSLKTILHALEQNLEDASNSLTEVDSRVTTLENMCSALVKENQTIRAKLDDLENRARRSNIRIIGIPERLEGPNKHHSWNLSYWTFLGLGLRRDNCSFRVTVSIFTRTSVQMWPDGELHLQQSNQTPMRPALSMGCSSLPV
ncbi:hypothetical protein SRHO_G00277270 [Serrasalmus rhombeus]